MRGRIDWKYALGLALTDPGFDHTMLSEFRTRLVAGDAGLLLLDSLLQRLQEQGLVKARGRQRTDSTHVLAAVRTLNRLERVGETMRPATPRCSVTFRLEATRRMGLPCCLISCPARRARKAYRGYRTPGPRTAWCSRRGSRPGTASHARCARVAPGPSASRASSDCKHASTSRRCKVRASTRKPRHSGKATPPEPGLRARMLKRSVVAVSAGAATSASPKHACSMFSQQSQSTWPGSRNGLPAPRLRKHAAHASPHSKWRLDPRLTSLPASPLGCPHHTKVCCKRTILP